MKKLTLSLALAAIALVAVTRAIGQSAPSASSPTKALSHFIHAVDDLDTTLAFYNNVFGLKGNPQDFANPAVPLLTNAPGVTLRLSMLALPGGMRLELTHFKGLERKAGQAKYTDPGAGSAVFYVRDIDGAVANAKKANAPIVTTGGAPIEIATANGKARSIILRDPDGFFLQLVQETPAAGAPEGNVHRVSLAYTMENADATRAFYTGKLGIELAGSSAYSKDATMLLIGRRRRGPNSASYPGVIPGPPASVNSPSSAVSAYQVPFARSRPVRPRFASRSTMRLPPSVK